MNTNDPTIEQSTMGVGNSEIPKQIGIQRGVWKHQYQLRHSYIGPVHDKMGNTWMFNDPVTPSKPRRQQVSSWYVTVQTNKRDRNRVNFASKQRYGREYKKRNPNDTTMKTPYWKAGRARGWNDLSGSAKQADLEGRGRVPPAFAELLSRETTLMEEMLREVIKEMQSNPKHHHRIFAFGSGIDRAKAKTDLAIKNGKYKKLRQQPHIGQAFARDQYLLPPAGDNWDKVFKSLDVSTFAIEYGGTKGGMHCHFYLNVVHYSQIQIDVHRFPQLLRVLWNQQCAARGVDHLKYEGKNPKTGREKAPHVWVTLQHETVSTHGINISKGNLYGNKETFRDAPPQYVGPGA